MAQTDHMQYVRQGVRLEVLTVGWMVVEAAVSLGAGVAAGSLLLIAFGLDSVIELFSGSVLLWRLRVEAQGRDEEAVEAAERRAAWIAAILLLLLCGYVLATSIYGLIARSAPETAPLGIAVSAAAVLVMPWLAAAKRRVAREIDSDALDDDAAESITCAYMAGTVLIGLVLNAAFHWWWAEPVAGLGFLVWLGLETREAIAEARAPE